jgi:hypothetical protein
MAVALRSAVFESDTNFPNHRSGTIENLNPFSALRQVDVRMSAAPALFAGECIGRLSAAA